MASDLDNETDLIQGNGGGLPSQIDAIANLPPNLAVMRMENDNIMALAAARPRSVKLMRVELQEQLQAFPKQAAKLIFAKPVGKEEDVCNKCGKELWPDRKTKKPAEKCFSCHSTDIKRGGQKFARGLSIRAAEMLAEVYRYNRVRSWMEPIDADTIRVCASFTDYQNGRTWTDESILSRYYTTKNKETVRHPDDRFYGVVARAQVSKVIREVVVRCVSAGLKAWLYDEADKLVDENLDDNTILKIVANFSNKQVSVQMLEKLLGRTFKEGWTKEDRKTLIGVWNAIDSGDETVASIFADIDKPDPDSGNGKVPDAAPKTPPSGNGATSTSDALKFPNGKKAEVDPAEQNQKERASGDLSDFRIWQGKIAKAGSDSELDEIANGISESLEIQSITKAEFDQLTQAINDRSKKLNE